ncbi:Gag-Pol polyprotein [Thelohanellus kitauei]|uniref:Gag-Pol polyprotein n=1 Tax=Thelohanellus kitauei TaxID=669202 RepID=A0A0C2JHK0_THEKT|nr:Gag-Pol polyprotein [Thelohanellus kitauei]
MAKSCNFPAIKDPLEEAVKTVFVCSISNETVLKAIFHKASEELKFEDIIDIATEVEEASKAAKAQLDSTNSENVFIVKGKRNTSRSPRANNMGPCFSCGKIGLLRQECRYRDTTCYYCNKKGHTEKSCKSKGSKKTRPTPYTSKFISSNTVF